MTKIIIFNEKPTEKKLEPIEFINGIDTVNFEFFEPKEKPSFYLEITVIKRNTPIGLDLFICKTDDGMFHKYLGHFNDGIVE